MLGQLSFTNIMQTLTLGLLAVYGFMTDVLHCTGELPNAMCTLPTWVPVAWVGYITVGFGIVAILAKLVRPGGVKASLFGPTAVVVPDNSPKSTVGTADASHVLAQ